MIQEIIITGLLLSGIYALLALGFSLVFGVARIINLTHTAFFMVASYLFYTFLSLHNIPVLWAVILTVLLTTGIGMLFYLLFLDRIREHESAVFIITVALALALQQVLLIIYGAQFHSVDNFIEGYQQILGVRVSYQRLLTFLIAGVSIAGLASFLFYTRTGLSLRVTAQDREVANLIGINVRRMCLLSVAIATALAAIAGLMVAPIYIIEPRMWVHPLVIILAVVVLGGLGSIRGSVIGALILAFTESMVVTLLPMGSYLKSTFALVIMLLVLMLRPEGLFGVVFEEERL